MKPSYVLFALGLWVFGLFVSTAVVSGTMVNEQNAGHRLTMRHGVREDLDPMTDILIAAFAYDPQFTYRYPYRAKYPKEHRYYVRLGLEEYFNRTAAGLNEIMVIVDADASSKSKGTVIALSIWDVVGSGKGKATPPVTNHYERPDGSAARMKEFARSTTKVRQALLYDRYGERQRSLRQMATDPRHWRKGAGSRMLRWGIEQATAQNVAITLFASPMGVELYTKFGFVLLGKAYVHVDGEKEFLNISCMSWEPRKKHIDGSILRDSGQIVMQATAG